MSDTEYIPIAALNQYAYCPHRCWRIFCAGEFTENHYTIEGTSLHERVHTLGEAHREETWQIRAIWLKSERYQLIGKSDLIEEAVSLTKEGLRTFLRLYEQKKQSKFKHPVLGRQCTYQEAFEIQARLLAKYLMGETDKYPPLVLK